MYEEKLIDGKKLAGEIYGQVKIKVVDMIPKPRLAIVLASEDPSSHKYVELKMQKAEELGIETKLLHFGENQSKDEVIREVRRLRNNEAVKGILLQLPLYDHLKDYTHEVIEAIEASKDADGLTAYQQGRCLYMLEDSILPATVEAALECLNYCFDEDLSWENIKKSKKIDILKGMNCLVINDSNMIGRPLAMLLNSLGGTVTIANEFTKNLSDFTKNADILISATGVTNLIDHSMIKENAILIDVTSVNKDGKVLGDFIVSEELMNKVKFITPVPGGVGPLTIACLLRNLVR